MGLLTIINKINFKKNEKKNRKGEGGGSARSSPQASVNSEGKTPEKSLQGCNTEPYQPCRSI